MILPKPKVGLVFRDMRFFNQALLAKQAWRLIDTLDSLCACLLKAQYYPNDSFLDTVFTGNSSEVWEGVVFGLELLKKGIICRVGNGTDIKTSQDLWIPRGPSFRPITPKGNCRLNRVSDFLDSIMVHGTRASYKNFLADGCGANFEVRPSPRQHQDLIAWQPEWSGMFSVKST